ncbi:sensor histidine kinase [Bradyrhizobium sp. STM 3557]|uniref:sensor histidine kinase n=1 Tax=Bradyrhizobium sp. STM 3557 TaxID=578920 RepID=UPI00388D62D7
MQIKETIGLSFGGSVEHPSPEDVVVLVDGAGVAFGVQRAFSARLSDMRDSGNGLVASRYLEIPLVGSDGEVSGILCYTSPPSDTRGAAAAGGQASVRAIADPAQFVHDTNNLLAVIGSGLRLLECQSDAAYRKAIVEKMREAITRGALLTRQLLDVARPGPTSIDGFVAGCRLAAMAGSLDQASSPDITVRTETVPDLWAFNADPEELYFALLNLCRNSADAMPDSGVITVTVRNVEASCDAVQEFVEIIVADKGEGMPEDVLSQAFTPYYLAKAAGSGTGLGLPQVRRFAEGRGGAVSIESKRGIGTLVRLLLPRAHAAGRPGGIAGKEIAYTPSSGGDVFHLVNPATAASKT